MDNLKIYNSVRAVPKEAQKPINGGRLKGMTDINPMWRIKTLTEQFGACGIGWYYKVIKDTCSICEQTNEAIVNVWIELYIKVDGEWSAPIPGVGGSMIVAKERNGFYASDEAYKMALTDALSVSCKALGIGADIYFNRDVSKYSNPTNEPKATRKPIESTVAKRISEEQVAELNALIVATKTDASAFCKFYKCDCVESLRAADYDSAIAQLNKKLQKMVGVNIDESNLPEAMRG